MGEAQGARRAVSGAPAAPARVGAPWPGDYEVTVRFADGEVTTTVEAGDRKIIFEDGRVEDIETDE